MKILILLLVSSHLYANTCLILNGLWQGDCLYRSEAYGDLSGDIEFQFKQNNCQSIEINQQKIDIPGQITNQSVENDEITTTKLSVQWNSESQNKLQYIYQYQYQKSGLIKDNVQLTGFFEKKENVLQLTQKGLVDQDPVQIFCDLKLRSR